MKKLLWIVTVALLAFTACNRESLPEEKLAGLWVVEYAQSGAEDDLAWTRVLEDYRFDAGGTGYYEYYMLDGNKFVTAKSVRDIGKVHFTVLGDSVTVMGDRSKVVRKLGFTNDKLTVQDRVMQKATAEQQKRVEQLYADWQGANSDYDDDDEDGVGGDRRFSVALKYKYTSWRYCGYDDVYGDERIEDHRWSDECWESIQPATKMLSDPFYTRWEEGDVVNVNGSDYAIGLHGESAYADGDVPSAPAYYGYFSCGDVANAQTTTPTVTVPGRYICDTYYDDGYQKMNLPLAAYSPSNTKTITFRQLTSAMWVDVTNSTGFDGLYIDSLRVTSASQNLYGSVTLDFTATDFGLAPTDGSNNTVTVCFPSDAVRIDNGENRFFKVPILPIASKENDLTVEVFSHGKVPVVLNQPGLAPANYELNYTLKRAAPALSRVWMGRTNIEITNGGENITTVDHSLFSISDTEQARFSQANLQATTTNGWSSWSFRFMEHQYDTDEPGYYYGGGTEIYTHYSNRSSMSLFCWGTSGYNHGAVAWKPNLTYGYNSGERVYFYAYCNANANLYDGDGRADWGYNAITNGGNTENSGWRTPKYGEWDYLVLKRSGSRFARAKVNGRNGLILLPDHYTHPAGLPALSGINQRKSDSKWNVNNNIYDAGQWAQMEAMGAVFLPASGYRDYTYEDGKTTVGNFNVALYYWSSSHNEYGLNGDSACSLDVSGDSMTLPLRSPRYDGHNVRLIRDVK